MADQKHSLAHRFHSAQVIHLAEVLIKHADQVMTKKWGLSYAQFKVLAILAGCHDSSQSMIAECLDLTPAAISRLTESLVHKKLITRHPKADNRRQNVLTISETGKQVLTETFVMVEELEKELYGEISTSDLTIFKKVLTTLLEKTSPHQTS